MAGMKDKHQEPGKGREEQERLHRPGQDPVHPGTGQERTAGMSPEELKRRGRDERHDESRDAEL
ncbi:hypothetical protein ACFVDH_38520 [Streptomyces sp. NPDC057674]|uniref:hypothetical protein n=1 Tax=Streptomyces sp. NPDC057674 TaxID=3346203 RepID=UPI0036A084F8